MGEGVQLSQGGTSGPGARGEREEEGSGPISGIRPESGERGREMSLKFCLRIS